MGENTNAPDSEVEEQEETETTLSRHDNHSQGGAGMEHTNGTVLQMGGGDDTPMREILTMVIAELSTLHQTTDIIVDVAVDHWICDTNGANYYTL